MKSTVYVTEYFNVKFKTTNLRFWPSSIRDDQL